MKTQKDTSRLIHVRAVTRSRKRGILSEEGGILKVGLHCPPVDGKANEELIELLSEHLQVRKSDISIIRGHNSRNKELLIKGGG